MLGKRNMFKHTKLLLIFLSSISVLSARNNPILSNLKEELGHGRITFAEYEKYEAEKKSYAANGNRPSPAQSAYAYAELQHLASLTQAERDRILQESKNRKTVLEDLRMLHPERNNPLFQMTLAKQQKAILDNHNKWGPICGAPYYIKGYAFGFKNESSANNFLNKITKKDLFGAVASAQKVLYSHVRKLSVEQNATVSPGSLFYPESTLEGAIERKRKCDYTLKNFIVRSDKKFWVVAILDTDKSPL